MRRKRKEPMPTARCPLEYKDGLKGCGRVFTIEEFFDSNLVCCSHCGLFFKVQPVAGRGETVVKGGLRLRREGEAT